VKVGLRLRLSLGPLHKPLQQARAGRVGRHRAVALMARQKITQLRLGKPGRMPLQFYGVVPHVNGWLWSGVCNDCTLRQPPLPRLIGFATTWVPGTQAKAPRSQRPDVAAIHPPSLKSATAVRVEPDLAPPASNGLPLAPLRLRADGVEVEPLARPG